MTTASATLTDWMRIIRSEYIEMPGLSLTDRQAERLWGLDPESCRRLLDALVQSGFLRRANDGGYLRARVS